MNVVPAPKPLQPDQAAAVDPFIHAALSADDVFRLMGLPVPTRSRSSA